MSEFSETIILDIVADNKKALEAIAQINKRLGKTGEAQVRNNELFSKMGKTLAGIASVGAIVAFTKKTIDAASNLQEAENKLNAVFGSKGQALVNDFATRYRDELGMSLLETKNFIADAGNLFTGFGMGEDSARKFSTEVLKLTNDLASFNNLSTEDAQRRMMSALMGESEAAKGLGASILEAQMKVAAADMGLGKYSNTMDELTKIQIRFHAIQMQSGKAVGDSQRSLKSFVAQKRIMFTAIERVSLLIGDKLLPAITAVVSAIGTFINAIADNIDVITALAYAAGAAGTAFGAYYLIVNATTLFTKALTAAQIALNVAMRANPIGIVITLVGALIGWFVYLYNTNEKIRYAFVYAWEVMKNAFAIFVNHFVAQVNLLLSIYNSIAEEVGQKPIPMRAFMEVKGMDEIKKIAKAKSMVATATAAVNPATGLGGSTSTAGGGVYGTGSTGAAGGGESYFKTYNKGASETKAGGGKMTFGDIHIHIDRKDETDDALIDKITYRVANEFQKAAKTAGVI